MAASTLENEETNVRNRPGLLPRIMAHRIEVREVIFVFALIFCVSPFASPPIALAIGIGVALFVGHPYMHLNHRATRFLLQASVVGLGFGMNLGAVVHAGRTGFVFTVASIFGTLFLGTLLGKLLRVEGVTSKLVSAGTAICGGSAIAAVGPVLDANEKQMSVALGTVFILNSVALFVFPLLGHALHLSPTQFGVWAGIAIHDTSSVVGAAVRYGGGALAVATAVKLARALWIVPVAFGMAMMFRRGKGARVSIPYFILLFVLASVVRTYFPEPVHIYAGLSKLAEIGLTVTLFLIGCGLTWDRIRSVGVKPLVQGVALWFTISGAGLWAVTHWLHS